MDNLQITNHAFDKLLQTIKSAAKLCRRWVRKPIQPLLVSLRLRFYCYQTSTPPWAVKVCAPLRASICKSS